MCGRNVAKSHSPLPEDLLAQFGYLLARLANLKSIGEFTLSTSDYGHIWSLIRPVWCGLFPAFIGTGRSSAKRVA
jgi:hypothetical protein